MMRTLAGVLLFSALLPAQFSAPDIGYLRDRHGMLRPVSGVAGAFVLGGIIERDVIAASFQGAWGCAQTAEAVLLFHHGKRVHQPELAADYCPERSARVRLDGDDIVIDDSGVRLRAPEGVQAIEQMGDAWFVLRTPSALYAVRTHKNRESIYQIPEPADD